jgi:hypothetical protein
MRVHPIATLLETDTHSPAIQETERSLTRLKQKMGGKGGKTYRDKTDRHTSGERVRHGDIGLVGGNSILLAQRLKLTARQAVQPQRRLGFPPPERRHRSSRITTPHFLTNPKLILLCHLPQRPPDLSKLHATCPSRQMQLAAALKQWLSCLLRATSEVQIP